VWRAGELDVVLQKDHADVPEVEEFHERYVLARRSMKHAAAGS
jgi:hypothetical protein